MDNEESTVVTETAVADAPVAESTPAEETKSEVAPVENTSGEYSQADVPTESEEAPAPAAEPETEAEPPVEEPKLAPKSENRFQQLANTNKELQRQIDDYKAREAQVAQEQELLGEIDPETGDYYTPQAVERIAREQALGQQQQTLAQQRYQLEVQQNQQTIQSEAVKALADFPMFDETSPEFDAESTKEADDILRDSLVVDQNGVIVGYKTSPYKIYQTVYNTAQRAAAKAQAKAQKSTERMMANADGTGSAQQGEASFEKLSVTEMQAKLRKQGHDI